MINYINILIYTLFILSINKLSYAKTAYKGNFYAICGMILALCIAIKDVNISHLPYLTISIILGALIGITYAKKVQMQNLPQMIALLNGFGGLSAGLIGIGEIITTTQTTFLHLFIVILGFITFSGSIASFIKLTSNIKLAEEKIIRTTNFFIFILALLSAYYTYKIDDNYLFPLVLSFSIWSFLFVLPIGGADAPIIISILNALSGWSTVLVGFSIYNPLLIITGSIIGSSGMILSHIMTKSMNRPLYNVLFPTKNISQETLTQQTSHLSTPNDVAFLMENANKIIIVPGYGMAVASAQHEIANMAKILQNKYHVDVKFAIHPVAGRMPGHMNVLLAEADVDTDNIFELKDINQEFQTTDVVYVIGANDITNPLAKTKIDSPIYKMPILEVEQAKRIIFVKRSMSSGYAGIDNPLFYSDKTLMLLGDAKEVTKKIVTELEED
ncbi:MAG: NAD(P)(+) transhydrogenase (Re/Si-specific) subunit beta [Alphaproteobacteria bacterium]|nr:NAD(P)(+) transhydrogenase (Re/Si-specific) subunit beta [Alphaproteobacteria bacterium]